MKELKAGKNECGENVVVEEAEGVRVTKVFQSNGWVRVTYEYDDGTVEETYER